MTPLHEYIESYRGREFVWGKYDCCRFVNGWAKIYCGNPFFHDEELACDDEKTALRVYLAECRKRGIRSVLQDFDKRYFPCDHVPPSGAIVARRDDGQTSIGYALGLVDGRSAVFLGLKGLVFAPLDPLEDMYWRLK
jgi:hypothetical protein